MVHHFVSVNFWQGPIIWPMVISTRTHGYKKPVISKGWIPFVRKNQLEVGDVVTILREEDEAGIWYRIEIERGSKPLPALFRELEEQQVPIFPTSNANGGVADNNVNVGVVAANILTIKQETQLAPANVPPIAQKAEELSLKPDDVNLRFTLDKGQQTPMFGGTLPSPVEEELKSTGGVQQQMAHQTHHDDTKTTNLDPILNQTSADEFRPNLDLTLAPPVVACEGNQAPTMGLFGTEVETFNPRIVLNLDLTLAPPTVY
ncbi:hypothetical protein SLEP1_g36558 [Rubroshorea leprosula]|uniref:TF-B3 domain-containing protein n=1 Tax=Rubroshorea leprosula TaxID=152421 RepID=A0AAV5KRV0_9ROSI|nr:hypothetical protein SLEP1_g36558 [Rubroshorea leprosula]